LDLPVFLTGFMGVGKSKIGLVLARRMGRLFFDTDQMVELRAGKAISAIFADEGEESFRRLARVRAGDLRSFGRGGGLGWRSDYTDEQY